MKKENIENMQYERKNEPLELWIGAGLVLGSGVGSIFGVLFGDIALGIVYGAAGGLLLMAIWDNLKRGAKRKEFRRGEKYE